MNLCESSAQNLFEWARKLQRPLILDGAIGSIVQHEFPKLLHHGIWMNRALIEQPEFIQNLHFEYIKAGADIITTFTFRTNPYSLRLYDEDHHASENMVKIAVKQCILAREKAEESQRPVLIAGSNTTMVDCYYGVLSDIKDSEIFENHRTHIRYLMEAGVDFILNETFSHLREVEIVCKMCFDEKIPYVMSLYCDENLKLLSGDHVSEAINAAKKYGALAVSFNCVKYSTMKRITKEIDLKSLLWGCYINCGDEKMQEIYAELDGNVDVHLLDMAISPEELKGFTKEIIENMKLQPCFVGSCCCSNWEHTKKLKELLGDNL